MRNFFLGLVLFGTPSLVYAQGTEGFTYARVVGILFGLVDIAFTAGIALATIVIVWNGIKIMTGGGIISPEGGGESYSQAKRNIWYALLGAAIIYGVNVILATIQRIVTEGSL